MDASNSGDCSRLTDGQQRFATRSDRADLGRARKSVHPKYFKDRGDAVLAAGNQQAAARLRVGEQGLVWRREVRRQGDVVPV